MPLKKSNPQAQTADLSTVLVTSYESTLSEFIKELSRFGINLDSIITSIRWDHWL